MVDMKSRESIIADAKRVFNIEIDALEKTRDLLDDVFVNIINEVVKCRGKVIITGIGKPSHIASKIAATMFMRLTGSMHCPAMGLAKNNNQTCMQMIHGIFNTAHFYTRNHLTRSSDCKNITGMIMKYQFRHHT